MDEKTDDGLDYTDYNDVEVDEYVIRGTVRTWILASQAVRKFQNFEANNFKNKLLENNYENNYDKSLMFDALSKAYKENPKFYLDDLLKFVYCIRKFAFNLIEFKSIKKDNDIDLLEQLFQNISLEDKMLDAKVQLQQSRAIKYLAKNGSIDGKDSVESLEEIESYVIEKILQIINKCKIESIKAELIWALAFLLKRQNEIKLKESIKTEIIKLVQLSDDNLTDLANNQHEYLREIENAKANLIDVFEKNQLMSNYKEMWKNQREANRTLSFQEEINLKTIKKKPLAVTKTIQTTKTNSKNKQTEQTCMKITNLFNALKCRNKKNSLNTNMEKVEKAVDDPKGDDRSMWRTTYG